MVEETLPYLVRYKGVPMNISQIYIAVSIGILAVIAILVFVVGKNKKEKRLTPLASFAFAFVLAGILFGENRSIGYGLMGVGIILAVADIFNRSKRTN
jgi:uncharacterized membrane protein